MNCGCILGPCGNLTSSSLQHKDFKLVHEPPIHLEAGDIHVDDKEDLFLNLTSEADVLVDQCNKEQKPFIELELFYEYSEPYKTVGKEDANLEYETRNTAIVQWI